MAIHNPKYCKYGSKCRQQTCSYTHSDQDYDNSYSHYDYEYDDQYDNSLSSHLHYSTHQNFPYNTTPQSQIYTQIYNSNFDVNRQKSYSCGNGFQYKQQPNKSQTQKNSYKKQILDSERGLSKRNNYKQYASVSSPLLEQLKDEIQVLFHVCRVPLLVLSSNFLLVGKCT